MQISVRVFFVEFERLRNGGRTMEKRMIVVCVTGLLSLVVTTVTASASAVLTPDETKSIAGGCTAICEQWWCPDGNQYWIRCDGNHCTAQTCGCTQTKEQVSRVASPTGGTAISIPNQNCAGRWDCDCDLIDLKCFTTASWCSAGDGGQWGGTYNKCVPVP